VVIFKIEVTIIIVSIGGGGSTMYMAIVNMRFANAILNMRLVSIIFDMVLHKVYCKLGVKIFIKYYDYRDIVTCFSLMVFHDWFVIFLFFFYRSW